MTRARPKPTPRKLLIKPRIKEEVITQRKKTRYKSKEKSDEDYELENNRSDEDNRLGDASNKKIIEDTEISNKEKESNTIITDPDGQNTRNNDIAEEEVACEENEDKDNENKDQKDNTD